MTDRERAIALCLAAGCVYFAPGSLLAQPRPSSPSLPSSSQESAGGAPAEEELPVFLPVQVDLRHRPQIDRLKTELIGRRVKDSPIRQAQVEVISGRGIITEFDIFDLHPFPETMQESRERAADGRAHAGGPSLAEQAAPEIPSDSLQGPVLHVEDPSAEARLSPPLLSAGEPFVAALFLGTLIEVKAGAETIRDLGMVGGLPFVVLKRPAGALGTSIALQERGRGLDGARNSRASISRLEAFEPKAIALQGDLAVLTDLELALPVVVWRHLGEPTLRQQDIEGGGAAVRRKVEVTPSDSFAGLRRLREDSRHGVDGTTAMRSRFVARPQASPAPAFVEKDIGPSPEPVQDGELLQVGGLAHTSDSTPATEETASEDPKGSPVVGAGWCVFRTSSKSTPAPVSPEAEEEEPVVAVEEEPASGCDAGIGVALYRMRRLAVVGVLGSKSMGFGLGWIIGRPMGRTLAVAVGYVCSWSSQGIESNECRPALGATLSLARARQ